MQLINYFLMVGYRFLTGINIKIIMVALSQSLLEILLLRFEVVSFV